MKVHGVVKVVEALLHHLFHREPDFMLEFGRSEFFLRCGRCGLRSPGVIVGDQPVLLVQPAVSVVRPEPRPPVLEPLPSLGAEWRAWAADEDEAECPAPGSRYLHH
jgi:hypothetical protein